MTPASVLLTPMASPLVGVALAAGLAVVTVGWLVPPLAPLLGAVCGGSLHLTERLVAAAQRRARRLLRTARVPARGGCAGSMASAD